LDIKIKISGGDKMKVRAIIFSLLLIGSILGVLSNLDQNVSAQTLLVDDIPSFEDAPVSIEYEFEVKAGNYSVIGVRPEIGDDFDLEIYTDTSYTTLIDNSTTVGDAVDFVVLDKDAWNSPPNRGARVTSGLGSYVIEMENEIDTHPVFDTWSGEMNITSGNPVLNLGPSGSWDDQYVGHPTVIYLNGTYHMWYSGSDNIPTFKIGYANSSDGITWNRYSSNPVLDLGSGGEWDSYRVYSPSVVFDGSIYHMWYTGYNNAIFRIGYANSTDGITWVKSPANPVLSLGPGGEWDDSRVYQPSIYFDGSTFHMWYSGYDSINYRIGYANSTDGISWIKHPSNPILNNGSLGTWDESRVFAPSVVYNGSKYVMCYTGLDGGTYRIGYATSEDGINWAKSPANPVLDVGTSGSWDDTNVHSPTILFNNTRYFMWYSGENGPNSRIGYATLPNMDNWEKCRNI
jgi:predicted GH43/DUF377 family glycosyl hydrolase